MLLAPLHVNDLRADMRRRHGRDGSAAYVTPQPLAKRHGRNWGGFRSQYPGAEGHRQETFFFRLGDFLGGEAAFRADHESHPFWGDDGLQGVFGAVVENQADFAIAAVFQPLGNRHHRQDLWHPSAPALLGGADGNGLPVAQATVPFRDL